MRRATIVNEYSLAFLIITVGVIPSLWPRCPNIRRLTTPYNYTHDHGDVAYMGVATLVELLASLCAIHRPYPIDALISSPSLRRRMNE